MEERLQKILAQAGVASRRAAEDMILAGRVRVNGRLVSELGTKADPRRDKVEVDGRRLVSERQAYVVLHKPRLVVSTMHDPEGRPTVADLVRGLGARLYPVGRLDFHTSGTLLLTNDGEFAHGLLHPREGVPKTYVVKVQGVPTEAMVKRWRDGVELDDGKTAPCEVRFLREEAGKGWLEVTLTEGRNQQIRRMGEATGHPVMRLSRLSFGGVTSEGLRPGEWRPLTYDELSELRGRYGVPRRVRGANDDLVPPARAPRARAAGGFGERRPARRGAPSFGEGDDAYEGGAPARGPRGAREGRGERPAPTSRHALTGPRVRAAPGERAPRGAGRVAGPEARAPRGAGRVAGPEARAGFAPGRGEGRGARARDENARAQGFPASDAARDERRGPATRARPGRERDGASTAPRVRPGRDAMSTAPRGRPERTYDDAGAPPRGRPGRERNDAAPRGREAAEPPRGRETAGPPRGRETAGPPRGRETAGPPRGGDAGVGARPAREREAPRAGASRGASRERDPAGRSGGAGEGWGGPVRGPKKSSAAVPSAKGQASKGTESRSPSRARRPR